MAFDGIGSHIEHLVNIFCTSLQVNMVKYFALCCTKVLKQRVMGERRGKNLMFQYGRPMHKFYTMGKSGWEVVQMLHRAEKQHFRAFLLQIYGPYLMLYAIAIYSLFNKAKIEDQYGTFFSLPKWNG